MTVKHVHIVSTLGVVSTKCSGTHIICLSSSWLAWHYINISELLVLYIYVCCILIGVNYVLF